MTNKLPYSTSFTAVGLEVRQFEQVCRWLDEYGPEADAPLDLTESVRSSTHLRKFREFKKRWEGLTREEKKILYTGDSNEKRGIAFLSMVRCYRLIGRFVIEVLWERLKQMDSTVTYKDYDHYFEKLGKEYPAMLNMAESTYNNSRNRVFRILRDSGLLVGSESFDILSFYPGSRVVSYLEQTQPQYLKFFLVNR